MDMREQNWPVGLKKTKQREAVLSVLECAQNPVSAQDIYAQIYGTDEKGWLSTVYRILEQLEKRGMIVRLSVTGSDTILYELNRSQHHHYAVCLGCHRMIPIHNCPMTAFLPSVAEDDFHISGHSLEIYGYCKNCIEKQARPKGGV